MRKGWLRHIWMMTMVVALLAGCTAAPEATSTAAPSGENELAGTDWVLVSFGPADAPAAVIEGSEITLSFGEDGQATGSGGCNTYGGGYQVQNGTVAFSEVVRTLRACAEEDRTQQETRFFEALEMAGQYELAGDELTLWYDNGEGVMRWMRA